MKEHTCILLWLRKISVSVEMFQLIFCMFICDCVFYFIFFVRKNNFSIMSVLFFSECAKSWSFKRWEIAFESATSNVHEENNICMENLVHHTNTNSAAIVFPGHCNCCCQIMAQACWAWAHGNWSQGKSIWNWEMNHILVF